MSESEENVKEAEMEVVEEEKSAEEIEWENNVKQSPQFNELLQANLDAEVIFEMFKLIERGMFAYTDIDEIVRKTICRLTKKQGVQFFKVLGTKDLSYIARKGPYLCSQIKIFNYYIQQKATIFNGPDQQKVQELLDRTNYSLKVSTGMRQYGGPPPNWDGEPPEHREISVSKIPPDWYEDKLVPVFEKFGRIYELRIMIDNITGLTRNFCYVKYCDETENIAALDKIDMLEIEDGIELKANFSSCNKRLFVGNLPKTETAEALKQTFEPFVEGLTDAEVFVSEEMKEEGLKNRGFVFLEFKNHGMAADAKRIIPGIGEKIYEGKLLKVEWAEPVYIPTSEESAKVKAVHVSNLSKDVNEDILRTKFEQFGKLFHVQKVRDYAFVHFEYRDDALKATEEGDGMEICGYKVNVRLSTSGPMKRKIKRKNEMARLRGEFGFGKRKERQPPPPPRNFGRGGGGGFRGNRGFGGGNRFGGGGGGGYGGQKRRFDDRGNGGYEDRYSNYGGGFNGGYGGGGGGYGGGGGGYSRGGNRFGQGGGKFPRY
ncbi:heterogeneous nuclear ribonucleoprotein R-like isoform X2 [Mya arenaria]|uniref:heterogeneous nuclear ribonucleoprotein R-like isoform X2 n=1 Tax=Mya arenaria TaxID=6604 RepID=UPI0022E1DCFB|nr:heterogeneous nuclear ribonucleoprotein R-like isoform X2 [Mya arenaria]